MLGVDDLSDDAAHCGALHAGTASAQVWFNEQVTLDTGYPLTGGITGDPVMFPGYGVTGSPNTGDVGVVLLDSAPGLGAASIAAVGSLDGLATRRGQQNVRFDVVGYGLQEVRPRDGRAQPVTASVKLVNLRSALTDGFNIHHSGAPGTGGGTCFGDSGGPILSEGTHTIVAVTSFGLNQNCAGGGFGFRVDTAAVADFLDQYT